MMINTPEEIQDKLYLFENALTEIFGTTWSFTESKEGNRLSISVDVPMQQGRRLGCFVVPDKQYRDSAFMKLLQREIVVLDVQNSMRGRLYYAEGSCFDAVPEAAIVPEYAIVVQQEHLDTHCDDDPFAEDRVIETVDFERKGV